MDYEKAMTIATVWSLALMLTGGYFIQNLPSFLGWVRFVSPFKYSYDACIKLGFDRPVPCTNGETLEECLGGPGGLQDVIFFLFDGWNCCSGVLYALVQNTLFLLYA